MAEDATVGKVLAFDKTPLSYIVIQLLQLNAAATSTPSADASLPPIQKPGALENAPGSLQSGIMAEYFQLTENVEDFPPATDLQQATIRRVDPQLNFQLGDGPFGQTELRIDFYVRWNGKLRIIKPGKYTFYNLNSDDGSRLVIGGRQVVDNLTNRGHDGTLSGSAKVVSAERPQAGDLQVLPQALVLDGHESYVELPPDVFSSLGDATLEAWVLWTAFDGWLNKQIFSCGPAAQDVWLSNWQGGAPHLAFANPAGRQLTAGRQDLPLNRWHHIAAVSGSKGMRLYLNGVLLGTDARTGSFKEAGATGPARLGRGTNLEASTGPSFHGKIAEFRVWRTMRSDQEIRENMFKKLTGTEDGLFGLWNFTEGTARDLSTNGYHGTLKGNAKILAQRWPEPSEVVAPAVVRARVTDEAGAVLPFFQVHVLEEGVPTLSFTNTIITTNLQFCVYPKGGAHKFVVQSGDKRDTVIVPEVKPAQRLDLNFVLSDAASLAGTLRMFDGTPHVAVPVQALDSSTNVVATALTDEQGNYQIGKIKAGSYFLRAMVRDGFEYFVEPNQSQFIAADQVRGSRPEEALTSTPNPTLRALNSSEAPPQTDEAWRQPIPIPFLIPFSTPRYIEPVPMGLLP